MTNSWFKYQSGAAVIITIASLLCICSLLLLSSVRTIKMHSLVTRHQQSAEQAFEAAEAGLEYGLAYLKMNQSNILKTGIDAFANSAITNVDNGRHTTFSIQYHSPIANQFDITQITATGHESNHGFSRSISQLIKRLSFFRTPPPASFISYGNTSLGGNITIENTDSNINIWSGGTVTLSGSASTKGSGAISSNQKYFASDIIQNDGQLSSLTKTDFFEKMLGQSKSQAKKTADLIVTYNSNQNLSTELSKPKYQGKAIWIEQTAGTASFSGTAVIGSQEKPIILVIDGDFKATGDTEIFGIIYITQDWHNASSGNLTVHGAILVEGNYSGTGTPNIIYDTTTLSNTVKIANFAKVPGSWHDFS